MSIDEIKQTLVEMKLNGWYSVTRYHGFSIRLSQCANPRIYCPVTAIAQYKLDKYYDIASTGLAMEHLGISPDDARIIVHASDYIDFSSDSYISKSLRAWMMACYA